MEQRTGILAAVSVVTALIGYILTCSGHPPLGLVLAVIALATGAVGVVMTGSTRKTEGMLNLVGAVMGLVGLLFSALGMIGVIRF